MASSVSGQDEWKPAGAVISYPSGLDRAILPARDYLPCPEEKFPRKPYNKSPIYQVFSVKTAGCWPRPFFASSWTETESSGKKKKPSLPVSSHLDLTLGH